MSEYTVQNFRLGAYATGRYSCRCSTCGEEFEGDKRALSCLPCELAGVKSLKAQLAEAQSTNRIAALHVAELEGLIGGVVARRNITKCAHVFPYLSRAIDALAQCRRGGE